MRAKNAVRKGLSILLATTTVLSNASYAVPAYAEETEVELTAESVTAESPAEPALEMTLTQDNVAEGQEEAAIGQTQEAPAQEVPAQEDSGGGQAQETKKLPEGSL